MGFSRRRLFQVGLGGGAVLALGSGLRWFTFGYRLREGEYAIGLDVKERVIARALVEALCPASEGLPSGASLGVAQRIDEEAWAASSGFRDDLVAALDVLEHCPPLYGHAARFSAMAIAKREALLKKMLASEQDVIAMVAFQLKEMVHAFYWGREETWPATSYDGPWITDVKPPESAARYASLLAEAKAKVS